MQKYKNKLQKFAIIFHPILLAQRPDIFGEGLKTNTQKQAEDFGKAAGFGEITLAGVVARVIMMFLAIMGMIFIALIVYAGFSWMTARGNEEKIRKAQDILKHAIWGLIITVFAYSIAYFVLSYLMTGGYQAAGIP